MKMLIPAAALLMAAPAAAQMFGRTAVADTELSAIAGRADIVQDIRASNSAAVSNNRIIGTSETGAVTVDGNAFQNLTGLAIISANSGNNVAINASLNVNVAIRPN